ncbi:Histidine kinase [Rhodovastum atsumiense]|uniref:histidine kinase n=1 Tax=Rhodovastum atsumiense TaxID=504468 RepID=A0A5M6IX56_9PROT|nr:ATP-binding protein [Rhodovastum atsumiense]KAA5612549.1 response regulator [Rhodovastum atsumiense]CAH2601366.1 Histidine kinase [Rhodovastum atsumiense]
MFQRSLGRLVVILQWQFVIALIVMTAALALREWSAYAEARRIVTLAHADRTLFDGIVGIRAEVGVSGVALLSSDDPSDILAASARRVNDFTAAALAALARSRPDGGVRLADAIAEAQRVVDTRWSLLADAMAPPLSHRDVRPTEPWRFAMFDLSGRIVDASNSIGNALRMLDPPVAELLQVRTAAATIREHFGRPCSDLRQNVQESRPLSLAQHAEWREHVGAYTSRWQDLEELLRRPAAPERLRADLQEAQAATAAAQARMDAIIHGLDGSGQPAMAAADWSGLCVAAYGTIIRLGHDALDLAVDHARTRQGQALAMLAVMAAVAVTVTMAGAFAIWAVQRRLIRPLRALVVAIERLSRQDLQTAVPATGFADELGAMAGALERLRASSLETQRLQGELARLREAEFAQANQLSRAKSAFLATMSHEVRTPLHGILGMAQLLEDSPLSPAQRRWLAAISSSGTMLLALLNDVLDFSKIEAGRMELERIDFNPAELLRTITASMAPQATGKGVACRLAIDDLPPRLVGDPAKLGQVLMNLIGNAIKFTERGEVVVTARAWIEPATGKTASLEVQVRDTGIGIAPEAMPHLFDAFAQSDSSITRRFGGTGLGLAIVQRIVAAMSGSITADSAPGQGSVFTLRVPLAMAEAPLSVREAEDTLPEALPCLSVLLAEDNEVNAAVSSAMLEQMGHGVTLARDGLAAAALAETTDFDVIMTDLSMPGLDGLGLCRRIRAMAHPTRRDVPVIALTADVSPGRMQDCLTVGMTAFLAKPFRRDELRRVLGEAIGIFSLAPADAAQASPTPRRVLAERARDLGAERAGRIVALFLATAPDLQAALSRHAATGALPPLREAAHQLKGAAAQVGLAELQDLAEAVQRAAESGSITATRAAVVAVIAIMPTALADLQTAWDEAAAGDQACRA